MESKINVQSYLKQSDSESKWDCKHIRATDLTLNNRHQNLYYSSCISYQIYG